MIATLFYPDGSPASGANVKIFKVSDTTRKSVSEQFTDSHGNYSLKGLAIGKYNVYAQIDSLVAFQDSISVLTDTILIENDTLETPTILTAIVGFQSNGLLSDILNDILGDFLRDILISVTVQVLGTDIYSNVNEEGYFTLDRMAFGDFTLKISTTKEDYATTYKSITLDANSPDTLTDTLWLIYTGSIPGSGRLNAEYGTLNGAVRLSGNGADYCDFRDSVDTSPYTTVFTSGIFFVDSIFYKSSGSFSYFDTDDYHFKYRETKYGRNN
jgi:hypothetical protein